MSLGIIALMVAGAGAGWLLWTLARGTPAGKTKNTMVLKAVIWFGLVAALAVAKLWPLAFMVLLAAAGVMGIELWRDRVVEEDRAQSSDKPTQMLKPRMDHKEAAAILGVAPDAHAEAIRAAHRKLMSQIHPDKGGTDYLAAQINEAREFLLAKAAREESSSQE